MHARFFTHGVTVAVPARTPLFTCFDRGYRRTIFQDRPAQWMEEKEKSLQLLYKVMGCDGGDGIVAESALGADRTVQEFWAMVGVDIANRAFVDPGEEAIGVEAPPVTDATVFQDYDDPFAGIQGRSRFCGNQNKRTGCAAAEDSGEWSCSQH